MKTLDVTEVKVGYPGKVENQDGMKRSRRFYEWMGKQPIKG